MGLYTNSCKKCGLFVMGGGYMLLVLNEQFYICFSWDNKTHSWIKRKHPLSDDPAKAKMFVRVYTVSPRKQELFAIRYK